MNKILMSTIAIAAVVAVAGVGSYALWSDTETAEDNYIAAGSLDLLVDGVDLTGAAHITVADVYPGYSETLTGTVKNNGTIAGTVNFAVSNVEDDENGFVEPETTYGDTTSPGELCSAVIVSVPAIGYNGPITSDILTALGTLDPGEEIPYSVVISVDSGAENDIMTDKCEFDFELVLNQAL